jgi:ankyrin repeat protein
MPKPAAGRLSTLIAVLRHMLPAWATLVLAAFLDHPLVLVLLIAANALTMTAICHGLGFDMELSFRRSVVRRGLPGFVLLTAYCLVVAILLGAPVWWLAQGGSMAAALTLSAAVVAALLVLWRVWPAFALPFLWDDAYPQHGEGSWLLTALGRSLRFARHLTGDPRLLLSHALPAALALLVLTAGALVLAGLGGILPSELRISGLVIYGLLVLPLGHLILANRCLRALLCASRRSRNRGITPAPVAAPPAMPLLAPDLDAAALDATLLEAARSGHVELGLVALQRGADPAVVPAAGDSDRRSALILSVALVDLRLLRALIARGANVNHALEGGLTPLVAATRDSYGGRPDAVMTLLANGADPRCADADGNTPLHHAARCAEPEVAALLIDGGGEPDAVNAEGLTPLGVACAGRHWAVGEFLLDRGARCEPAAAEPPLLAAAGVADDDVAGVRLLLDRKARVNVRGALGRTALMVAALAGNEIIVAALLDAGAAVDAADANGTTALMEAVRAGAAPVIHALGKRKVDVNAVDANGRAALVVACQSKQPNVDAVRALLAMGADRAATDADDRRAVDHAAMAGRWPIVALLDPDYPVPSSLAGEERAGDQGSEEHLLDALRFGHWNVVEPYAGVVSGWPSARLAELYLELLDPGLGAARCWLLNHGLDPQARCGDGNTLVDRLVERLPDSAGGLRDLLARGASSGAGSVARVLSAALPARAEIRSDVSLLARDLILGGADWCGKADAGATSLHLACMLGDAHIAGLLLDRGADPDARDGQGRLPLHLALRNDSVSALELVRQLLRHGADPALADACGETPLGLALSRGERELGQWLDWNGWSLPHRRLRPDDLCMAAASGDRAAVERLLTLGLPIDAEDPQGATALVRAAGTGDTGLVAFLLDRGADPGHPAHSGVACLAAAVSARQEAVVRLLLERGAEPDRRLPGGSTPLMVAAALGLPGAAALLLAAGADANAVDEHGTSALHAAARFAFAGRDTTAARELLTALLAAGAHHHHCNADGQDALLLLLGAHADPGADCQAEHLTALAGLVADAGAGLDVQDHRGVGVLHACALHGLLGCARVLKGRGARLDLADSRGRTAGEVAAMLGYVDLAAELGAVRTPMPVPGARQTLRRRASTPE